MEASKRQQQVTNQTTWVANGNESVKPYIDEQTGPGVIPLIKHSGAWPSHEPLL